MVVMYSCTARDGGLRRCPHTHSAYMIRTNAGLRKPYFGPRTSVQEELCLYSCTVERGGLKQTRCLHSHTRPVLHCSLISKPAFSACSFLPALDPLVKRHIYVVCFCCHFGFFDKMTLVQFTNCTVLRGGSIKPGDVWVRLQRVLRIGFLYQLIFFHTYAKVYEGKVVEGEASKVPDSKIDCAGLLIAPGLIDLQVCAMIASLASRLVP